MIEFFKNKGVFLFDESNSKSESTYYKLEDLFSTEEGSNITDTCVGEEEMSLFYDCTVLSEEEAIEKYNSGEYKKFL